MQEPTFSFPISLTTIFLSVVPMVWLLISLGFLRLPAHLSCIAGLLLSLAIAVLAFEMKLAAALQAVLEGAVFALIPIIWVIIAAFFTYNISRQTGALEQIRQLLAGLSGDRRIQALLIAWGFGSFLESVAGFGTAVAVPAAILIALGFEPFLAALICLLANTIAVAFGVVGIPIITLARIAELPVISVSAAVLAQLTPFVLLIPASIIFVLTGSLRGFSGVWSITLAAGASFAAVQYLVAINVGPELPAIIGSIVSSLVMVVCAKQFPPRQEWKFPNEQDGATPPKQTYTPNLKAQLRAWSPYLILLLLVLGSSRLVPGVNQLLAKIKTIWLIYDGPDGKPLSLDWLLTPGTLVCISAVLGGWIQGASSAKLCAIFAATVSQLRKTAITVIAIVSMAKVLSYSGMVNAIAAGLAGATGSYYPFFAPFIGALGTFLTGSDTSSNILFGLLQKQTALQLGINPVWITATNGSGGSAGKLLSPQSIVIAAAAAGITGREGDLLKATLKYAVVFLCGLGVLTYVFA